MMRIGIFILIVFSSFERIYANDCESVLTLNLSTLDENSKSDLVLLSSRSETLYFLIDVGDAVVPIVMFGDSLNFLEFYDKNADAGAVHKYRFRGFKIPLIHSLIGGSTVGLAFGYDTGKLGYAIIFSVVSGIITGLSSCGIREAMSDFGCAGYLVKQLKRLKRKRFWINDYPLVIAKFDRNTDLKSQAAKALRRSKINNARQVSRTEFLSYLDFRQFAMPDAVFNNDLATSATIESEDTGIQIKYTEPYDSEIDPELKSVDAYDKVLASPLQFMKHGILNIVYIRQVKANGSFDDYRKRTAVGYSITVDGRTSLYLPLIRDPAVQKLFIDLYRRAAASALDRYAKGPTSHRNVNDAYLLIGNEVQRVSAAVKERVERRVAALNGLDQAEVSETAELYDHILRLHARDSTGESGDLNNPPRIAE